MASIIEEKDRLTKTQVVRRIRDWRARVEALFSQIEKWAVAEWGPDRVSRGTAWKATEYPMQRFGLTGGKVSTLIVNTGKKTLTFYPTSVWVVGADGMVDLLAGHDHYSLYDTPRDNGRNPRWEITTLNPRVVLETFTRDAFLRIAKAKPRRSDS